MPWTCQLLPDVDIVETVYAGTVDRHELAAAIAESRRLLQDRPHGRRLLSDCTTMAGGHSIADLYFVADELASTGFGATFREAVLIQPDTQPAANVQFWEDVCTNRGLAVKVFDDRAAALHWLQEPAPSH